MTAQMGSGGAGTSAGWLGREHTARRDALVTKGMCVADRFGPSTGIRYQVRLIDFSGRPTWHVFVGGLWHSRHSSELSALNVLQEADIDISDR